jgi:hypothetical protein
MLRLSPLSSGKFGASFHVLRLFVGQPTQPSNIAKRVLRPHRSRSRTSAFDFTVFISVAPFVWTFSVLQLAAKAAPPNGFQRRNRRKNHRSLNVGAQCHQDKSVRRITCSELKTSSARTDNIAHFQTTLSESERPLKTRLREWKTRDSGKRGTGQISGESERKRDRNGHRGSNHRVRS